MINKFLFVFYIAKVSKIYLKTREIKYERTFPWIL